MKYPSNWLKIDLSRNNSSVPVVAFKSAGKPAAVLFLSGNVNYRNVTLATIATTRENQLTHAGNILHLVSSTPATFAGNSAHKIVYTTIAPQGKFEAMRANFASWEERLFHYIRSSSSKLCHLSAYYSDND